MVDLSRRKTILGMGLLASGSGAAFSSASFSQSTESGADFRVVADQQLVVAANSGPADNVTTEDQDSNASNPTEYLFGGEGEYINTENIDFGDIQSDGEAAVNGETNDALEIAVAVTSDEGSFDPILEVTNEGDTAANVGISISQYGDDVSSEGDETDKPIAEAEVDSAFDFKIAENSVSNETFEEVTPGNTEDISIDLDLTEITPSDLQEAADPGDLGDGDVFGDGAAVDTVSLVDAIEVGVEESS